MSDDELRTTIDREMYEQLRSKGYYIGEDPKGQQVHISEDFTTVGESNREGHVDAWGPVFPIDGRDSEVDDTEPVADYDSKTVLLRGESGDGVRVTAVHSGRASAIPEQFEVTRRTNTYHGPVVKLKPGEEFDGERVVYELTCPGPDSHPVLWKPVTDADGFVQSRVKVAKVSAEIFDVAGYDICETCEEPITDPMHRSLALMGECPDGQ